MPRTKCARATTVAKLGLLLACLACASFGQRAARVRVGLVGMQARALISCLGPPEELHVLGADDHQLWVYKRFLSVSDTPKSSVDLTVWGSEGNPIGRLLPAASASQSFPAPIASTREAGVSSSKAVPLENHDPRGQCHLYFEIRSDAVAAVRAAGFDHRGLKAVDRCTLKAKRCVAP